MERKISDLELKERLGLATPFDYLPYFVLGFVFMCFGLIGKITLLFKKGKEND